MQAGTNRCARNTSSTVELSARIGCETTMVDLLAVGLGRTDRASGIACAMIRGLLPCAVLLSPALLAQSFQSNFGAGKYEEGVAVVVDELAITSVVRHYREGYGYGIQLLRTSLTGTSPVTIDIPLPGAAFPQSAVRAADGDIVICGSIIPTGRYDHDALLLKVTAAGSTVWTWTSADPGGEEQFLCVDVLDDGYAAGGTWRQSVDSDALLARFTAGGALQWQDHYGTPQDDRVTGIAHDGTGLVAVGSNSSTAGDLDAFIVRTDLQGVQQWQHTWGGEEDDAAAEVIARADGSFVWAGYTDSYPLGDTTIQGDRFRHVYAMAITINGDSLWSAAYGDTLRNRQGWTLLQATNNELLFAGENELGHRSNAFTIRAGSTGALIWERTYPLQRTDRLRDLLLMPDGGFIGTGKCTGAQSGQVLLVRKNSNGL
jgi:hypothetical protein